MAWRQGKLQNGDVLVFGSIETLVSFSSIWCVCWMQDDGVARVLPGEMCLVEILWSNCRRICYKENK